MNSEFEQLTGKDLENLCCHVLEDALRSIFGDDQKEHKGRPKKVHIRDCREGWQWVCLNDEIPLSFIHCATLYGVDPFELREQLQNRWICLSKTGNEGKWDGVFVSPLGKRKQIEELFTLDEVSAPIPSEITEFFQLGLAI